MAIFNQTCPPLTNQVDSFPAPEVDPPLVGTSALDPLWVRSRVCYGPWQKRRRKRVAHHPHKEQCFPMFGELFWFGHLHIIPTSFDLGNVLSTQERTYDIFNGYRRTDKQFTTIAEIGTDGFSISGQPAKSPNIIRAGQTIEVTVQVEPSGPIAISASIEYTFASAEFLSVTFTGSRVVIMTAPPQSNIDEHWGWVTDIITAGSGDEQRIAVRDLPRQAFTYRFIEEDQVMAWLENQIWGWAENVWAIPVWTDYTALTSDAALGVTVLGVESTDERDFRSDPAGSELALIWTDKETVEAIEVDSFTSTTITATSGLLAAVPAGTLIMPLRLARMLKPTSATWYNVNAKDMEARWSMINNTPGYGTDGQPSPGTPFDRIAAYRGLPVWDLDFDFLTTNGNYSVNVSKDLRIFPDDLGKVMASTPRKYPKQTMTGLGMQAYGRSEFFRLRNYMAYFKGRQKAIWVNSTRQDFIVESTTTTPATTIRIQPVNYTNQVFNVTSGPKTRQDIAIEYIDGTIDYRRVIDATEEPGLRETLTLDSGISQDVSIANVARISYLIKRRLTTDRLTYRHEFYEGEVSTSFGLVDVFDE